MKYLLIFTIIYSKLSFSLSLYDMRITNSNGFPHNIDTDFTIKFHHPDIKKHHLYAVIILEVINGAVRESQKIFIYPGFQDDLDRKLKEIFFHAIRYRNSDFNIEIVVKFYRASQGGNFSIYYSAQGAENIHLQLPLDSQLIYNSSINLFRPPIISLAIDSEDGHQGGLTINKPGIVTCISADGFPAFPIEINFQKEVNIMRKMEGKEDREEIMFMTRLEDHLNNVTCKSGGVSASKLIKVFHHATSVEIFPDKSYLRQHSVLECRSSGDGYPTPSVMWTVPLNKTTETYFTISNTDSISYLTINANAPNNSRWQFNCSSLNVIPPMKHGGPHKTINVTIGDNPEAAKMASARIWTITMAVVVVLIILLVCVLCFGSKFHCRSRSKSKSKNCVPVDDVTLKANYIHVRQEEKDEMETLYKDDCVV